MFTLLQFVAYHITHTLTHDYREQFRKMHAKSVIFVML